MLSFLFHQIIFVNLILLNKIHLFFENFFLNLQLINFEKNYLFLNQINLNNIPMIFFVYIH